MQNDVHRDERDDDPLEPVAFPHLGPVDHRLQLLLALSEQAARTITPDGSLTQPLHSGSAA